jgi:hypothetical protein
MVAAAGEEGFAVGSAAKSCVWRAFGFAVLAAVGAILTELKLPEAGEGS